MVVRLNPACCIASFTINGVSLLPHGILTVAASYLFRRKDVDTDDASDPVYGAFRATHVHLVAQAPLDEIQDAAPILQALLTTKGPFAAVLLMGDGTSYPFTGWLRHYALRPLVLHPNGFQTWECTCDFDIPVEQRPSM
jgi:hypothetical protein